MDKIESSENARAEAHSAINRAVASELRAARARKRLSRRELAARTGLSESTIVRFEAGERSADVVQLIALCEALDVSAVEILEIANNSYRRQ